MDHLSEEGTMGLERILIVDDSSTSRMIIKRCLEKAGLRKAQCYEAEDGLKALTILKDLKADLVLSDLKMPKMDGATFIRKLRLGADTKHLPVIVISSMGNDMTERELLEEGAQAIIRKPVSPDKILEALESIFDKDAIGGDDELVGDELL